MNLINKYFTCEGCGKTYLKGWSDEEMDKEAKEIWDVENASAKLDKGMAVVCDDCFVRFHPSKYPDLWDRAIGEIHEQKL